MPIGGFVINVDPKEKDEVIGRLTEFPQVEVHGADDEGNVVAVLDTKTSEEMEQLTRKLEQVDGVLSLGITYFDAEDELEKIESGELNPSFSFGRKGEKPKGNS